MADKILMVDTSILIDYFRKTDKRNARLVEGEGQKILILLNFSSSNAQAHITLNAEKAQVLLSNYKNAPLINKEKSIITLNPYQAVIYTL